MTLPTYIRTLKLEESFDIQKLPQTIAFTKKINKKNTHLYKRFPAREHGLQGGLIYLGKACFVVNLSKRFAKGGYKSVKYALFFDRCKKIARVVVNACTHNESRYESDQIAMEMEIKIAKIAERDFASFVGVYKIVPTTTLSNKFSIIQEPFDRDVLDLLRKKVKVELSEKVQIALGISRTLRALHAHGYAHCDIKSSNALVKMTKEGYVGRLHDFGAVITTNENKTYYARNRGTQDYQPPEWWRYVGSGEMTKSSVPIAKAADIWQLGMLFYYLLDYPFELPWIESPAEKKTIQKRYELFSMPYVYNKADPFQSLVVNMIQFQPNMRPEVGTVVARLEEMLKLYRKESKD